MSIENIFVYSFGHSKECYDFYFTNQNVQSKETFFEDTKAAIKQIILDCVAASSIFYNDFEIVRKAKKILLEKGYLEIEIYSNHIQYSYKSSEDNQDETMHFEISQPDYFKEKSIYQVSISSAYYSYLKERFIYKSSSDSDKFNSI